MRPVKQTEFAALMAPLGPFEPNPRLAVAVSGGPDSMALAMLSSQWAHDRGGTATALIVDHGIRPESAAEAEDAARRLAMGGMGVRILNVTGLSRGSALAERAREARYSALIAACREAGLLHLLLGHHALDQAETLMIRALSISGAAGLAGMAALTELTSVRLLRPLLGISPGRFRATLTHIGMSWAEDPSNRDRNALRVRLRLKLDDPDGTGRAVSSLVEAACCAGAARAEAEAETATELGRSIHLSALGFAVLRSDRISPRTLAAIIRTIGGEPRPPAPAQVAALAGLLKPATLGGTRILPAGRFGPGHLITRETAAMHPPVPAVPGATWDNRFRLGDRTMPAPRAILGPLGSDAVRFRRASSWPAAVLQTLPAIRSDGLLLCVPHLGYPDEDTCDCYPVILNPPMPAGGAVFMPAAKHRD